MENNKTDVRLDLRRDRLTGNYRWVVRVPGHVLGASDHSYRRRIDCLHAGLRVVGVKPEDVSWTDGVESHIYDYGQAFRSLGFVEVFVWKRWWRR